MTFAWAFACLVALQLHPDRSSAVANAARDLGTLAQLEFGRHPVGVQLIRAWDSTRPWPSAGDAAGTKGRPVQITLFYPSVETGAMPVTLEEHILADWVGEFRTSYTGEEQDAALGAAKQTFEEGLDRALTHVEWTRVRSVLSRSRAAAEPRPGAHPLILLQAGMTSRGFTLLTLAEALASHGYVVGALATFGRTHAERLGFDAAGVRALADDASFALGLLSTRPEVDASRIGLMAWSVGGVSQAWLRLERPEAFRAAVSLDSGTGYSYGTGLLRQHPAFNLRSPRGPFLQFDVEEANSRIARDDSFFRAHPKDEAERFVLTGLLHGDLVLPYGVGRSVALGTPAKSLRALGRVLLTFLERHLRGNQDSGSAKSAPHLRTPSGRKRQVIRQNLERSAGHGCSIERRTGLHPDKVMRLGVRTLSLAPRERSRDSTQATPMETAEGSSRPVGRTRRTLNNATRATAHAHPPPKTHRRDQPSVASLAAELVYGPDFGMGEAILAPSRAVGSLHMNWAFARPDSESQLEFPGTHESPCRTSGTVMAESLLTPVPKSRNRRRLRGAK